MGEKEQKQTDLDQWDYNLAQVYIVRRMIRRGIIKTYEEYAMRFAPIYEMLANGAIEASPVDWNEVHQKVIEMGILTNKSLTK